MVNEIQLGVLKFYILEGIHMKISDKDIFDAILNNDTAKAAEMLEGFDLTKDGTPPISLPLIVGSYRQC